MRRLLENRMPAVRTMSNLQIIEELCNICAALNYIVKVQADALDQLGAVVMEEERSDVGRALTALIGHDEAQDPEPIYGGGTTVQVFYFCNGKDPNCSHKDCHLTGGNCCHTIDRAFAKETDGVRLFEEADPDSLFEIDPNEL